MNATSSERLRMIPIQAATPVAKASFWKPVGLAVLVLAAAAGLFKIGYAPRLEREHELNSKQTSAQQQLRVVNTSHAKPSAISHLRLPANIQPFQSTDINARVDGYLKAWHAEIGDRVAAGKLLAEIDAPELDQQLRKAEAVLAQGRAEVEQAKSDVTQAIADFHQAEADVVKADASLLFALTTEKRYTALAESGAASKQQADESVRNSGVGVAEVNAAKAHVNSLKTAIAGKEAVVKTKDAMVRSYEADVQRLVELESFKSVIAPFDGVITKRLSDVGSLINAGNAGKGRELFTIVSDDSLRIQVSVPQDVAARITTGQTVDVSIKEFPTTVFKARVKRTAGAIDLSSRTLLTELELPNPDHKLLTGTYAEAVFTVPSSKSAFVVPANALLVNKAGVQIAVVGALDSIHLTHVTLGKDFGDSVEVLSGIALTDELIVNPADNLREAEKVEVKNREAGKAQPVVAVK